MITIYLTLIHLYMKILDWIQVIQHPISVITFANFILIKYFFSVLIINIKYLLLLGLNYSDKNIMEKLETVCNEQNIQRLMIERLLLKMDYIAQALKDESGLHTNISIQLDEDF